MMKLSKFENAALAILLGVGLFGYLCFQAGEASGLKKAAALIHAFGSEASSYNSLQTTENVRMAFMPQYGNTLLGSTELESDTVYRIQMNVPRLYWNADGYVVDSTYYAANDIKVEFFYPSQVPAGGSGRMVIKANFNDQEEPLIGVLDFTAADDLRLINGNDFSYSGYGDIVFRSGALEIEFYTGATDGLERPEKIGLIGHDRISCNVYPY